MNRKKAFIRGLSSTFLQKILTKIIGLIVTPIVLSYLTSDEYGIWLIIGSLLGYLGLMDFGITGAVTAIFAKNNTYAKEEYLNIIVNNAFALQVVIAFVVLLTGSIFSFYFPEWFHLGHYDKENAWKVFIFAVLGYAVSFPPKSLKALIRARQKLALAVWLEFSLFLGTTLLSLYLLHHHFGLLALPYSTLATRIVSYLLFYYFAKQAYPSLNFDFSLIKVKYIKEIFKVSSWWFLGMVAGMVIYSTDTILIGLFLSSSLVTIYALTNRLSEVMRDFIYSVNFMLMPGVGQMIGEGKTESVKHLYLRMQTLLVPVGIIGSFFLYLFTKPFVTFWVGEKFYYGDTLVLFFSLSLFTMVVFHSSSIILSASLQVKYVSIVRTAEALVNIVLSIILLKSFGLVGTAAGTLLAGVLTSFWLIPYQVGRFLQISLKDWKPVFVKLFTTIAVYIPVVLMCQHSSTLIALCIFTLLSCITLWFYLFDEEIRKLIVFRIKNK